jgi:hypothetical protein
LANYGEDATATTPDGQGTRVEVAASFDSDEIDHKYVYQVPLGGLYIELAHYASVKQVVLQNMSGFPGDTFYVDNTTGDLINDQLCALPNPPPNEHISFCDPDVTVGIMLYSIAALELTDWHIVIVGRKD